MCLDVLEQLGCEFPRRSLSIGLSTVSGLLEVKRGVKRRSKEEIDTMTIMDDPQRIAAMRLMDKLVHYCYSSQDKRLAIVMFKQFRWTLRYGCCDVSPTAIATTGAMLSGVLFDFRGGSIYAQYALQMLEKMQLKTARTIFVAHAVVLHWTKPYQELLKPLLRSYELGLQTGDVETAMGSTLLYILIGFYAGRPLEALEADCRIYAHQAKQHKRGQIESYIRMVWQLILNLMGRSENSAELTGEAMDEGEFRSAAANSENPTMSIMIDTHKSIVCTFFGEHEMGAELALKMGEDLATVLVGSPHVAIHQFYKGISYFAMARKTKKGKYIRELQERRQRPSRSGGKRVVQTCTIWIHSLMLNLPP